MVKTTKRFPIIKSRSTFDKMLQDGDISQNVIQALIEDTNQIYSNGKVYSFIPPDGKNGQLLSYKSDGEYEWVNNLNDYNSIIDLISYGITWDNYTNNCTRIGNMQLHRELPIQSKIRGVIAQGDTIMYDLNPDDWRFRKEPIYVEAQLSGDINYDVILECDEFKNLRYDDQYIKIPVTISYVTEPELALEDGLQVGEQYLVYHIYQINTDAGIVHAELQLHPYNWITESTQHTLQEYMDAGYSFKIKAGINTIELGSCRNGYDGTVRQYIPQFYIRSWMDDEKSIVRISEVKVDETWTEQPESLLDAYCCTQLNAVPENMGYLSTLEVNSWVSIYNINDYCIGSGNKPEIEKHRKTHPFLTNYGKCNNTPNSLSNVQNILIPQIKQTKSQLMTLYDYQNILYWLFAIEYNTLIPNKKFNNSLTAEGFRQGGHGDVFRGDSGGYVNIFNIGLACYNYFPVGLGDYRGNNTTLIKYPSFNFYENSVFSVYHFSYIINKAAMTGSYNRNVLTITSIKDNSQPIFAFPSNPDMKSTLHGNTTFTITGLQEGQELTFCNTDTLDTALITITQDGEYVIPYTYIETKQHRRVYANFTAEQCNIVITCTNMESIIVKRTTDAGVIPRWRGFDTLVIFGTIVNCYGVKTGSTIDIFDYNNDILQKNLPINGDLAGNSQFNLKESANILYTSQISGIYLSRFVIQNTSYLYISDGFGDQSEASVQIKTIGAKLRTITHLR